MTPQRSGSFGDETPYRLGEIGLGDVFRAVDRLRPRDFATALQIARCLGFEVSDEAPPDDDGRSAATPNTSAKSRDGAGQLPESYDGGPSPERSAPTTAHPIGQGSIGFQLQSAPPAAAARSMSAQVVVEPLSPPEADPGTEPPPIEPLFERVRAPSLLMELIRTSRSGSTIDVARAIATLARGAVVDSSTLAHETSLDRGVQLLVDLAPGMRPFAADRDELVTQIGRLVPGDRCEVLRFAGSPNFVGTGSRRRWCAYQPPPRGRPVVVVTDLGIGHPLSGEWASPDEWSEFARHAGDESPVAALVPYPAERWPDQLRNEMAIIEWDRGTTVGVIRSARERHAPR